MTTSSPPDGVGTPPARTRMAGLLPDRDGPVFAEPWQAQAFALAVVLHEQGHFTWAEWAETMAAEIKAAQAAGDPDDGSTYYLHWLAALERLVTAKALTTADLLVARKAAWADAYAHTPHGQPVVLGAGDGVGESP